MPRLYSIYDANVYREVGPADFNNLRSAERSRGVVGFATYSVAAEVLAHLAHISDPDFGPSLAAVRRIVSHCTTYNGAEYVVNVMADPGEQLAHTLFGLKKPGMDEQPSRYGSLLGSIATASEPSEWAYLQPQLDVVKDAVAKREQEFVSRMWNGVLALVPGAESWNALSKNKVQRELLLTALNTPASLRWGAGAMVGSAAKALGVVLSEVDREAKIDLFLAVFPLSLHFYHRVLRRIAEDGINLSLPKHSNSFWDMQLVSGISSAGEFKGVPMWLITTDGLILKSAKDLGGRQLVLSLAEYTKLLSGPTEAVDAALAAP